jgi:hypothetical protein
MRAKNSFHTVYRGLLFGALASGVAILALIAQPVPVWGSDSPGLDLPRIAQGTTDSQENLRTARKESAKSPGSSTGSVSADARLLDAEQRLQGMEETLQDLWERSLYNKLIGNQMIKLARAAVIILVVIAIGFPLTLVFLGRRRILGPWNVTSDLPETLIAVEERQAKLANILREIQSEIDYIHSMSVPDLKKLIDQAEKYIQQNEKDLEKAGLSPKEDASPSKPKEEAEEPS